MEARPLEIHPNDRIYKTITLHVSHGRAWKAISDPQEFGAWFGATFDPAYTGPFVPHTRVTGTIRPSTSDRHPANEGRAVAGTPIELVIHRVDPDRLVSFRWHPFAVDRTLDYAAEPMTLVSLELEDSNEGVVLTMTESGFDRLPPARRERAYAASERDWELRTWLMQEHVARVIPPTKRGARSQVGERRTES